MNVLTRILCRCSGYSLDAVAMVPNCAGRAVAQGVLMLLVAVLASLSWGYAGSRLLISSPNATSLAVLIGAIGFAFVFSLDYQMAVGIRKPASWGKLAAQAIPRVLAGVVIAWFTAEPLLLRMNETTLLDFIRTDARRKLLAEQTENRTLAGVAVAQQTTDAARQAFAAADARAKGKPDSAEWANAKASYEAAQRRETAAINTNQPRIDRAAEELRRLEGTEGPDLARRRSVQNNIIATGRRSIADARRAAGEARRHFDKVEAEWHANARQSVDRANAALGSAVERLDLANADATTRTLGSEASLAALAVPDLTNLYTAKVQLEGSSTYPAARGLRFWDWGIHLIMVMFEMSVLLIKLVSPSDALDAAQAALDAADAEKARNAAALIADASDAETQLAIERCHLEQAARMAAMQQQHEQFERVNHVAQATIEQERINRARGSAADALAVLDEIRDEMA